MYESVPRVPITEAIISRGVACAFDGERREKYDRTNGCRGAEERRGYLSQVHTQFVYYRDFSLSDSKIGR